MNNAESNLPGTITRPDAMEISILIGAMTDMRVMIAGTKSVLRLNALQQDLRAVQQRLAALHGATHGWALSRSDFTAAVLARRGLFDGRGYYAEAWSRELVDHPFYYRKDRMACAVAAHLYGTFDATKRQDIAAFAELKGLQTTWPEDFPSWWLPGRTTLVVYTPLTGPAQ